MPQPLDFFAYISQHYISPGRALRTQDQRQRSSHPICCKIEILTVSLSCLRNGWSRAFPKVPHSPQYLILATLVHFWVRRLLPHVRYPLLLMLRKILSITLVTRYMYLGSIREFVKARPFEIVSVRWRHTPITCRRSCSSHLEQSGGTAESHSLRPRVDPTPHIGRGAARLCTSTVSRPY